MCTWCLARRPDLLLHRHNCCQCLATDLGVQQRSGKLTFSQILAAKTDLSRAFHSLPGSATLHQTTRSRSTLYVPSPARVHQPLLTVQQLLVCLGVSLAISAINFGSDVAFNAVVGVSNAALCFSYIVSVGCVRLKRLRGEPLLPARWSLGRWGGLINDISLIFLAIIFIFSFFPTDPSHGDPEWAANFNWAIVLFAATCALASGYYVMQGRRLYVAPVSLVKDE